MTVNFHTIHSQELCSNAAQSAPTHQPLTTDHCDSIRLRPWTVWLSGALARDFNHAAESENRLRLSRNVEMRNALSWGVL